MFTNLAPQMPTAIKSTTKERSLDWYKEAVRNGQRFQLRHVHSNMWPVYKSYYRHKFPRGTLPVNLVFSVLRSIVPQVYFRDPAVSVTPTKPGLKYEIHARIVESIDNWLLRELASKYEFKKLITDAFLCGIGTGFVGYDSEFGYDPTKTVGDQQVASLTQFDKKGYRLEYNSYISPGMPWFLRARPEDVVYPWGCESLRNSEWIAMRVFRPLDDIKKDPKYKNTKRLSGMYTQRRTHPDGGTYDNLGYSDNILNREYVELWQLRDAKTGEIVCFTMDHDEILRKDPDPLQIEGLPAENLVFNPDPDWVYGIPDARIIEPQLLELNEIRTQAMKHRRVDILKFLYKKGSLKKEQLDKMLSEHVQAGIEVNADVGLRDAVMPLQPGASQILADLERAGEVVRGDVREVVGFSRVSTGQFQGKTHVTKTEVDAVAYAGEIRVDERRDGVADLLTNVIKRFNQIIFKYWTTDQVRSIVGPDGAKMWLKFTGPEIRGEYNYKIDPTNAIPVDPRTKRQDAISMAEAWANMNQGLVKQGMPVPEEIQRYFFSQFPGINVDRLLQQQSPQQGPGQNPDQALPPEIAAQMMQGGQGA